jgi:hypothetical protein
MTTRASFEESVAAWLDATLDPLSPAIRQQLSSQLVRLLGMAGD